MTINKFIDVRRSCLNLHNCCHNSQNYKENGLINIVINSKQLTEQ